MKQKDISRFTAKPKELAEKLGVTQPYINSLVHQGVFVDSIYRSENGRTVLFDLELAMQQVSEKKKTATHGKVKKSLNLGEKLNSVESDEMSFNDAKELEQVYKAKLARLKFERESGKLIEKQAVYRELFNIGKSIRDSLLSVPDRCVDNVLAARSRREGHGIILEEITKALEEIAGAADKFERAFGENSNQNEDAE